MKVNREVRRTSAQFLNSLAVAILIALAVAPFAIGAAKAGQVLAGVAAAALLHLAALWIVVGTRN